jgi:hypothetical protein
MFTTENTETTEKNNRSKGFFIDEFLPSDSGNDEKARKQSPIDKNCTFGRSVGGLT